MNHKEQIELISRVLTLPFFDFELYDEDIVKEYLDNHYLLFIRHKDDSSQVSKLKQKLAVLQEKLLRMISQKTKTTNLDRVKQTLNAFFFTYDIVKSYTDNYELSYLDYLVKTSRSFLTFRDGKISIKWWISDEDDVFSDNSKFSEQTLDKIEIWNTLMRIFIPDVYIAALYASSEHVSITNLTDIKENVALCDKPLAKILEKGIAETHLHMNAGMGYLDVWALVCNVVLIDEKAKDNYDMAQPLVAGILRLFFIYVLEDEKNCNKPNSSFSELLKDFCNKLNLPKLFYETELGTSCNDSDSLQTMKLLYESYCKYFAEINSCILGRFCKSREDTSRDLLDLTFLGRYKSLNTPYEILLQFLMFRKIKYWSEKELVNNTYAKKIIHMFIQYIRLKNSFFEDKRQGNNFYGLQNFIHYYDKATDARYRITNDTTYRKRIQTDSILCVFEHMCSQKNLRKLELRIAPKIDNIYDLARMNETDSANEIGRRIRDQLTVIFDAFIKYCDNEIVRSQIADSIEPDSIGSEEKYRYADELQSKNIAAFPSIGIIYHFIKNKDLDVYLTNNCWVFDDNDLGQHTIQSKRIKYRAFIKVLCALRAKISNLSKYIVGIDAASIENETEPWVLAPVFQYSRDFSITYPTEETGKPINNLGLTYHVGEDYYHLISGLRHIHEVIHHYKYISGDRIAHAIALQLNAFKWAEENSTVAIPQGEYLDNLLWLWDINSRHPQIFKSINANFEHKIMMVVEQIYGSNSGLTPFVLWQAYTGRFENLSEEQITRAKKDYIKIYMYNKEHNSKTIQLCRYSSKKCANQCPLNVSCAGTDAPIWDKDKLIMTHHCPVHARHYNKSIFVSVTKEDAECISLVQQFIKKEIEAKGICVEVNITSNTAIGDIESLYNHPFSDLNNDGLSTTSDDSVMISINSDDPLVFSTNAENEFAMAYYTLLHNGYSRSSALNWINFVRQAGMDSCFIKLQTPPSIQIKEIKKILTELESFDFSTLFD